MASKSFIDLSGLTHYDEKLNEKLDAKYVSLTGSQTISGAKTFSGDLILAGTQYGINKTDAEEDANDLFLSVVGGAKRVYYTQSVGGTKLQNIPALTNTILESYTVRKYSETDCHVNQIAHNTNGLFFRRRIGENWSDWKEFAFTDGNISGNAATASKVVGTAASDSVTELVRGTMTSNDAFRIAVGGGSNAGYAEIATADDYSEPIYVRQYQGGFATLKRTATLLDGSGNTSFPGTLTAARFNSPLSIYKVDSTNTDVSANDVPIGLRGLSRQARSCKTAFTPAANVTVEYSIDGGTTWLDYGATNAQKQALFAMQHGASFQIGKGTAGGTSAVSTNCKLRVTVAPADRYATVDCVYLWVCAYNHTMKVDIETSTIGAKTTFAALRTGVGISGWAGANFISFDRTQYGGGSNQTTNRYAYRFTFYCTAIGANAGYPDVRDIRIYGPFSHTTANSMMGYDSLYSWDVDQNASFPANVSAVKFTGTFSGNITGNVTGSCSGSAGSVQRYVAAEGYADVIQTFQSDNSSYRSCTIRCTNGNGFNEIVLGAHNESNAAPSGIAVRNTNGTLTATAPTPASATDSSTYIATTAWVRNATGNTNLNAATATKATQDGSGNVITETYATKSELNSISAITTAQIDTLFA